MWECGHADGGAGYGIADGGMHDGGEGDLAILQAHKRSLKSAESGPGLGGSAGAVRSWAISYCQQAVDLRGGNTPGDV
jgi:hypothetical protein